MEQEIRYARLLEIPVDSCTVITKKSKKRAYRAKDERLKNKAIEEVNKNTDIAENLPEAPQAEVEQTTAESMQTSGETAQKIAEEGQDFCFRAPEIPARFAAFSDEGAEGALAEEEVTTFGTTGASPEEGAKGVDSVLPVCEIIEELPQRGESESVFPLPHKEKKLGFILTAAVCAALSLAFLLNAFIFRVDVKNFMRSTPQQQADTRLRGAFSLVLPTAGAYVIENGIMQFSDKGGVYATEDGKIAALTADENGFYTMEIAHSDLFKTVITGVSMPFGEVGQQVYRAQPVAYGTGETVSVSFYEKGELLSCAVEDGTVKV